MNTFVRDIKQEWIKQNNHLMRLIMVNIGVFVVLKLWFFFERVLSPAGNTEAGSTPILDFVIGKVSITPALGEFIWEPWTLFTFSFVHFDLLHLVFNMLMLYWFGRLVTEFMGSQKLLALYVWGGLAGGLLYLLLFNTIPFFVRGVDSIGLGMIGASASIYAIIVGIATLLPDYQIFLLFFGPVKLKWVAAVTVFLSFIAMAGYANQGGNVAHVGGALMGYLFVQQLRRGNDLSLLLTRVVNWTKKLFNGQGKHRASRPDDRRGAGGVNRNGGSANPSQDEIDRILDKIGEKGYESLTQEEKQLLFKASQKK
jgi:membrane associated rhomboid family serine protease